MKELVLINENRFYVYQHRILSTGELFYIGHGTGGRMRSQHSRSKSWLDIVKHNKCYHSIVKDGMSKQSAEELELQLIAICKPRGNVRTKSISNKLLDTEEIDRKFYYDESSPTCLRYKINSGKCKAGDTAGYLRKDDEGSRYVVGNGGTERFVHRIVWYICAGNDPANNLVDHVNGDTTDNRISNLRLTDSAGNNRNRKIMKNHPTSCNGVHPSGDYYVAGWSEFHVRKQKHFSCLKHGKDLAFALAVEYRYRMIERQAELGFELTERHKGIYQQPELLRGMSEDTLTELFACNLFSNNISGASNVHRLSRKGIVTWVYSKTSKGEVEYRGFSVQKYGETLAKALAVEYSNRLDGCEQKSVDGYSLKSTNEMLTDLTGSKNNSGIVGIAFREYKTRPFIYAQKTIEGKKHSKRFWISKLGLLESIALAIRWRKSLAA